MSLPPDVKAEIARLERMRPDPNIHPDAFREINDEITRLIDRSRQWQAYGERARKVV